MTPPVTSQNIGGGIPPAGNPGNRNADARIREEREQARGRYEQLRQLSFQGGNVPGIL